MLEKSPLPFCPHAMYPAVPELAMAVAKYLVVVKVLLILLTASLRNETLENMLAAAQVLDSGAVVEGEVIKFTPIEIAI